jgi:replicative DNA helicase
MSIHNENNENTRPKLGTAPEPIILPPTAPDSGNPLSSIAAAWLAEEKVSRDLTAAGKKPGAVTGFPIFDRELGGFIAPGFTTLLAAPSCGKSALCLQIGAQCECPCIYVSSEMDVVSLFRRVVARTTGQFLDDLRGGKLSDETLAGLMEKALKATSMLSIKDALTQPFTVEEIIKEGQALKTRFDSERVLIIIDSFTDWAFSCAYANPSTQASERQIIEAALESTKSIRAALDCPIIGIVHKSRSGQGKTGADAMFSGKESGRIEYFSENLWSLEPKESETPHTLNNHVSEVVLALVKNRHGVKGAEVTLDFEGRKMEFRQPTDFDGNRGLL